ncbi:MAG: hypothetical protein ACRERV_01960 [Methylococcales bacterium]
MFEASVYVANKSAFHLVANALLNSRLFIVELPIIAFGKAAKIRLME